MRPARRTASESPEVPRLRDGHAQGSGYRFEDDRGGLLVDRRFHRRDVIERHLNEVRKVRSERISKLGITGRQGEARVPVVAALDRNDFGATRRASRCLDRDVDGLTAGHPEHDPRKRVVDRCGQARSELRALSGYEMMIADVELPKRRRNGAGHSGIAVPKAEDAAVAMAVDQTKPRVRVFEPNAFALPHHELKAHPLVVRQLVGCDVLAKHGCELRRKFRKAETAGRGTSAAVYPRSAVRSSAARQEQAQPVRRRGPRRSFCATRAKKSPNTE